MVDQIIGHTWTNDDEFEEWVRKYIQHDDSNHGPSRVSKFKIFSFICKERFG